MTGKTPESKAYFLVIFKVLYLMPEYVTEMNFSVIAYQNQIIHLLHKIENFSQ